MDSISEGVKKSPETHRRNGAHHGISDLRFRPTRTKRFCKRQGPFFSEEGEWGDLKIPPPPHAFPCLVSVGSKRGGRPPRGGRREISRLLHFLWKCLAAYASNEQHWPHKLLVGGVHGVASCRPFQWAVAPHRRGKAVRATRPKHPACGLNLAPCAVLPFLVFKEVLVFK
jgi:hypothetical protein